jgi:hypothetical protein
MDLEGIVHGLIKLLSWNLPGEIKKNHEEAADIPVYIRT